MINKKTSITALITAFALLLTTGCNTDNSKSATSNTPTPTSSNSDGDSMINDDIPVPQRVDGSLTILVGFSTNSSDPRAVALMKFKEDVEKKTEGSIHIDLYPDGQKGSDSELITSVINGTLGMTVSSAGNFTGYSKNVGVSALPFLFNNFEDAWKFMDSGIISEINKDLLNYNIRVLAHFDNGFRCITTKSKPINTPQNMIDLNIRIPDNAIVRETMNALEAKVDTLPFTELYNALALGTFEAQENPVPVIYNNKLYEVQKYLSITNHSYDAMPLVISNAIWNELTKEEQQIIQEAASDAQTLNRSLVKQQTTDYENKLQNECGMIINRPDLAPFKEKTKDVATYFSYNQALLNSIYAIIK